MSTTVSNNDRHAPPLPDIAGYRVLRVLNHGGMSTVYLGQQLALSREVAIKVMQSQALSDEVSRRRFENEARTIARLEHPHIVNIYEVGRTGDGLPYYSMPYLARGHLGQRSFVGKNGVTDEARVIDILRALLSAIEYAHSCGVIHRDVKAENVLFDDSGRPLLADFGIALRRGFGPRVTAAGLAVGSTAYMAPEQARGEDVDGRADLYSLGVLTWEMLTGHLPYQAADALSMAVMHAQDPIPKLPVSLRHWQRFMNRALAKGPLNRFQSVAHMREAVAAIEQHRVWPRLDAARDRVLSLMESPTKVWASLVLLVVAGLGSLWLMGRAGSDSFFGVDASAPATAVIAPDPTDAMMAPLPEAPLQRALDDTRRQIAQRKLTAPEDGNAYSSALAAWHADSTNPEVHRVIGELTNALGDELARNLRSGNDTRARDYFTTATALGEQTGNGNSAEQRALRKTALTELQARMDKAVKRYDREAAQRVAALAPDFDVPTATAAKMIASAKAVPRKGQVLPGDPAGAVLRDGRAGAFAISQKPVTRGDYQRFTSATGRAAALCRERASVLRLLSPRSWQTPGFTQGNGEPVVCVSFEDAEAYALWYSRQTGHRYRLPNADEARKAAAEISGRDISLWLRDCGRNCQQRQAAGSSWRNQEQQRALTSGRGYDDVGFRLVREL